MYLEENLLNPESMALQGWPERVKICMTQRVGGDSSGAYASFNLGAHVGDDLRAVIKNRQRLQEKINARAVFLKQVHGVQCAEIFGSSPDGLELDACLSTQKHLACTIMVADCLPILITNTQGSIIGAAHAGWRGLAGSFASLSKEAAISPGQKILGVVEGLIQALDLKQTELTQVQGGTQQGAPQTEWLAWLGPCIGPSAFEVGADVVQSFAHLPSYREHFQRISKEVAEQKWMADLAGLARKVLALSGVTRIYGNDGSKSWCTHSNPERYFSHRRDKVSGRMAACIWRV